MSMEDETSFLTENHVVAFDDSSNPKRKSFEIAPDILENGENAPPNENTQRKSNDSDSSTSKRTRTQKAAPKESLPLSTGIPKKMSRGSGLPKPLNKRTSQIRGTVKAVDTSSSSTNNMSVLSTSSVSFAASTNVAAKPESTATPFPGTPYKNALLNAKTDITEMPPTGMLTRSLRKHQADYLTQKDKIQYFFQSGISIKDDRVNAVIAPLGKPKSTGTAKFFDRG
jgi:hypothetical protein